MFKTEPIGDKSKGFMPSPREGQSRRSHKAPSSQAAQPSYLWRLPFLRDVRLA